MTYQPKSNNKIIKVENNLIYFEASNDSNSICCIDNSDSLILEYTWSVHSKRLRATIKCRTWMMHRKLFDMTDKKQIIDHIDGNPLNNSRSNLRITTQSGNMKNQNLHKDSKSGYKGVSFQSGKYRAYIVLDYKQIHLGRFDSKEEAARAYNAAAIKYHGEYAKLNKID
jgi:hypothetical protein